MTYPSAPNGRGRSASGDGRAWGTSGKPDDEGWGPATAVQSGAARHVGRAHHEPAAPTRAAAPQPAPGDWNQAGPLARDHQRATQMAERTSEPVMPATRAPERGLPWWAALIVLVVIAVVGGLIDTVSSIQVQGGFNIGIVVASILAILIVKRSHMFPIVISPPIVYSLAAVGQLYIRSRGLKDKGAVLDGAANYLVYGFPAIAAASAAVLIIAGIRLIIRK